MPIEIKKGRKNERKKRKRWGRASERSPDKRTNTRGAQLGRAERDEREGSEEGRGIGGRKMGRGKVEGRVASVA